MTSPFVVAGCPVRQRAWIIEKHIEGVALQGTNAELALFYLENDSTDPTRGILSGDSVIHGAVGLSPLLGREKFFYGRPFMAESLNTNHPGYARTGEHRYHDDQHANLARLRNHWIERVLELYPGATHFWMVDSDVVPDPDCLEKLLEADKDIVAGVVRNGTNAYNFMRGEPCRHLNMEPWRNGAETLVLEDDWHHGLPIQVSLLGACVLVRREVLERKTELDVEWSGSTLIYYAPPVPAVRFGPHPKGEDFVWCSAARMAKFDLWLHPLARTTHYMEEGREGLR